MTADITTAEIPKPIDPDMAHNVAVFLLREAHQIRYPEPNERDGDIFQRTLTQLAKDITVAAFSPDQEILGVGILRPDHKDFGATLIDIAVHSYHRREGIGSRVLSEVERLAAEAGHETLSLLPMYGTFRFYHENGYSPTGNDDMYAKALSK